MKILANWIVTIIFEILGIFSLFHINQDRRINKFINLKNLSKFNFFYRRNFRIYNINNLQFERPVSDDNFGNAGNIFIILIYLFIES